MNDREKEIFIKGIRIGMQAIESANPNTPRTIEQSEPKNKKDKTVKVKRTYAKKTRGKKKPWTEEEDQNIRDAFASGMDNKEMMSMLPDRTYDGVIYHAYNNLKIKKAKKKEETEHDELAILNQQ